MPKDRIPRQIHYCWFGGKPKPPLVLKCLASWQQVMPTCELVEWDEGNFNIEINPFVRKAYMRGKYAFVADYCRLLALYKHGGIYMDADVELLKPLDKFLIHRAFTGHETADLLVTAVMGSEPEHPWIKLLLDYYRTALFTFTPNTQIITRLSQPLIERQKDGFTYLRDGVVIYPRTVFCDYDHVKLKPTPTEASYAIHHFAGTWLGRTAL